MQECLWTEDCDRWETGCGEQWVLIEGTPEENGMRFCPCCGRRLTSLPPDACGGQAVDTESCAGAGAGKDSRYVE